MQGVAPNSKMDYGVIMQEVAPNPNPNVACGDIMQVVIPRDGMKDVAQGEVMQVVAGSASLTVTQPVTKLKRRAREGNGMVQPPKKHNGICKRKTRAIGDEARVDIYEKRRDEH